MEAQLRLALLSDERRRTYTIEHDLSGLERGDLLARLQAYEIGVESRDFLAERGADLGGNQPPRRRRTFHGSGSAQPAPSAGMKSHAGQRRRVRRRIRERQRRIEAQHQRLTRTNALIAVIQTKRQICRLIP